jgi:hypothetical protein
MGRIESARDHARSGGVHLPEWLEPHLEEAREWCRGRMWIPRAILLAYLVYAGWRTATDYEAGTIFGGITFAIHEMGHVIFSFAGHFIGSLMGSGMQVLVPILVMILFYRQPDYFGIAVGGFWLSFSMFDWARYVADARLMELPLVGFTDDPEHDWHYLLDTMGLLNFDTTLAFLIRLVAGAVGIASLAFAVWLLLTMARTPVSSRA